MQSLIATIQPRSAFGGSIRGDTLFGQLCWATLHRRGEQHLNKLLEGYPVNRPFLVVSDAFPAGYLPRPALPLHRYEDIPDADRKQVKKRNWLARKHFSQPLSKWLEFAVPDRQIAGRDLFESRSQSHNTINRLTGTTGAGEFAPYTMPQQWYAPGQSLELYLVYDEARLDTQAVKQLLEDVGMAGYGRDASIGLGKFELASIREESWPVQDKANAWLTLAPCAPQGQAWVSEQSWYQPFIRFGRHGDLAVHFGKPFKTPLLMADTAALLMPQTYSPVQFTGQGVGGDGSLSKAIPATVHQGYAPVLPVCVEESS